MASSSKFTLLSTRHLASQSPETETTLPSLIATSEYLADDAKEALPFAFDTCTYTQGYLRQSVWSCMDCGEKGVCYGCSITCHGDHRLVELWTKRHFRCDCPTSAISEIPGSSSTGTRYSDQKRCKLNPHEYQPHELNEGNRYGKTFRGIFCRCGRDYDPETETEAMVACIGCEDWFHESCLTLKRPGNPIIIPYDEDEDAEDVLIPSDSYDGLVCAECVLSSDFLRRQAGQPGFMIIEPQDRVIGGGCLVIGRQELTGAALSETNGLPKPEETRKRPADEVENGIEKRPRLDETGKNGRTSDVSQTTNGDHSGSGAQSKQEAEIGTDLKRWRGKGDIFLANGVRERLKQTLPPQTIAGLPFPLEDEEIYEPPKDEDPEETIEQVTERVVGALPRVQAIEALHGYQNMKNRLKTMLSAHVQSGQAVSKEDIERVFDQLRASRQ